jgi:hypothetical protein
VYRITSPVSTVVVISHVGTIDASSNEGVVMVEPSS